MTSVFLNLGQGFNDDKINIFKRELEKRMSVKTFDYAIEQLDSINELDITTGETGHIFYLQTMECRKNKNYINAFCNLIGNITTRPSAVYLMPEAPKKIVAGIRACWPDAEIYHFQYDIMKPSERIEK